MRFLGKVDRREMPRSFRRCCKGGSGSGRSAGGGGAEAAGGGGGGGGAAVAEPQQSAQPTQPREERPVTLPDDVNLKATRFTEVYSFKAGRDNIKLTAGFARFDAADREIDFKVNGKFDRLDQRRSSRESLSIALKLRRIMNYDAKQRPDGFIYVTRAYTVDGFGSKRAEAYTAMGFSRPEPSGAQFAIVRNGRLVPYERET